MYLLQPAGGSAACELRDIYQSLPIEWTHTSVSVTLQTDSGPQFASIWLPKFVCVCVSYPDPPSECEDYTVCVPCSL